MIATIDRRNVSGKKNKTRKSSLRCVSSIDRWDRCTIARILGNGKSTERTGSPPLRSRNRASRRNYNGQRVWLGSGRWQRRPPFPPVCIGWIFNTYGHDPKSIFFFGRAHRNAPRRAGNKFVVNVRGAGFVEDVPLRSTGKAGRESGAVAVPRHSIYRKDGDIMQSMGMPGHTHARAHKEPPWGDIGRRGERSRRDRTWRTCARSTLCTLHLPRGRCRTRDRCC